MMSEIAFKYDEKKNPDGAVLDGVPRRDLTAEEFEALQPHYQAAVLATAFYTKVAKAKKTAVSKKAADTADSED